MEHLTGENLTAPQGRLALPPLKGCDCPFIMSVSISLIFKSPKWSFSATNICMRKELFLM